ncbi:MAG: hypothetical protein IKZ13_06450 [Akkermansia sp.]|nr:hypothetical protein [Akkermansia sp.]
MGSIPAGAASKTLSFVKEIDKNVSGVYAHIDKILDYFMSHESFNREDAQSFVRQQKPYTLKNDYSKTWRLADMLDAPELYEAYPRLKDILVSEEDMGDPQNAGSTERNDITINENSPARLQFETLLHETQHIIQDIEEFAAGSDPDTVYTQFQKAYERIAKIAKGGVNTRLASRKMADGILKTFVSLAKDIAPNKTRTEILINRLTDGLWPKVLNEVGLYLRAAGEVEARNVTSRLDWTLEQRKNIPFNDTLKYNGEAWVDFSLIADHLESWQRDPVAELGELGRFGNNIQGKLAPIGENVYDERVTAMINALSCLLFPLPRAVGP